MWLFVHLAPHKLSMSVYYSPAYIQHLAQIGIWTKLIQIMLNWLRLESGLCNPPQDVGSTWIESRLGTNCAHVNSWCVSSTIASTSTSSHGSLWSDEEARAIWGEANVQEELDGAVRNKVVYKDISNKLQEQGCNREWKQCKTFLKRRIDNHNRETGRGRKTCRFLRSRMQS